MRLVPTFAFLVILATPAGASVLTIGSSNAEACYRASSTEDYSLSAMHLCDAAMAEPLSRDDRLATHVNRGIVRMGMRRFAEAETDFRAALAINARQPEAWLNAGVLKIREGDGPEAARRLDQAIANGTKRPALAYYARGLAHEMAGNLKAAYGDLRQAQTLDPDWPAPRKELTRYRVR